MDEELHILSHTPKSTTGFCPNIVSFGMDEELHILSHTPKSTTGFCPNIVSFGMDEELHILSHTPKSTTGFCPNIVSFGMDEELHILSHTPKSTTGFELHLKNSSLSKFNLFHVFGPSHYFFRDLTVLDLSGSDIVSIPASFENFFRLSNLILNDCMQLKEIQEFPRSLLVLRANGCISLESLPRGLTEFSTQWLSLIKLARCYRVNMWNWNRVRDLLGRSSSPYSDFRGFRDTNMIFPGKKIPDWFSNCREITANDHRCEFDIQGYNSLAHYGIALCAVIEPVGRFWSVDTMIGSVAYDSNHYVGKFDEMDSDHVWLQFLAVTDVKRKRGISLNQADNLRIIFESAPKSVILKSCGVQPFGFGFVDDEIYWENPVSTLDIELFMYTSDMCHDV
ncbi:hypothetical protein I3842_15G162800 [Carya illinoinensis]|uniref:Uncharacterized protein n=1 Tax=Carya illinoinensis TaxID=32201 RepID=A0A922A843_CARIL|nr:hypothetical protein I3842_15G162800 [Carya illinoinensis]